MTDQPFESLIANERTRISKERDKLSAKKGELDTQIAALDRELQALDAYERVKNGGKPSTAPSGGRRTGQREAVLQAVKAAPEGVTAAQVLSAMNAESDADKTSIRNALSALKKAGTVSLEGGVYKG